MSEQSQLLLRHILEAPYPKNSEVCISRSLIDIFVDFDKHSYFSPMQLVASKKTADEQNFDKMKTAYDACLNEEQIATVGPKPLLKALKDVKKAHAHSIKDAILLLAEYGISGLVSVGTGADDTDPDAVVVSVSAPYSFGLPSKERYEDDKLVEKYRGVAVEVLSALYPDAKQDTFAKIIDLEKKLAAASPASEDRDDVTVCSRALLAIL